jgi:hypothetical protein
VREPLFEDAQAAPSAPSHTKILTVPGAAIVVAASLLMIMAGVRLVPTAAPKRWLGTVIVVR